jgi:hypothetical protein
MPLVASDATAATLTEPLCQLDAVGAVIDTEGAVLSSTVAVTAAPSAVAVVVQLAPDELLQPDQPVIDHPASREADMVTV